ncbi:MAG TPA: hypothetical protein VLF91_03000 [Candidatus Saccharimonadales bacterium]|nr:hypothetical protein [Candidatus Saccharimonadales bacterium]
MKRLALCLAILCCLVSSSPAAAHFLAQADGMSAVLHTDPDDAPAAGKHAQLTFYLSALTGTFAASDCDCSVSVQPVGGSVIAAPKLSTEKSASILTTALVFPRPGNYSVVLRGRSYAKHFAPFRLAYPVGVVGDTHFSFSSPGVQVLLLSLASLAALFVMARRQIIDGGRYRQ